MTRQVKYTPAGDDISVETAYLQAATLLDIAAKHAIQTQDVDKMQTLAVLWMDLGEHLLNGPDQDDDDEKGDGPVVVGFGNGGKDNERVAR